MPSLGRIERLRRPRPQPLARGWPLRLAGAGLRILTALLLAYALGFVWYLLTLPGPAPAGTQTDGVAVLTGGPGRLARGVAVLEAGAARRMLVSGVNRTVTREGLAAGAGVPGPLLACCIELGFEAHDTRSNAREVAHWAARHRLRSIRLVTADYHLPRAMGEVRAALPPGLALVGDGVADARPLAHLAAEYAKLLASRARLLLRPRGPEA